VARIVGRERELTREFLRLEAHFLFHDHPFPSGPASSLLSRQFLQGGGRWTTPEA
jgi:hypothetical protein